MGQSVVRVRNSPEVPSAESGQSFRKPRHELAYIAAVIYLLSLVGLLANFVGGDGLREFSEVSSPVVLGDGLSFGQWVESVEPWYAINYIGIVAAPIAAFLWWRFGNDDRWLKAICVFVVTTFTLIHVCTLVVGFLLLPDYSP